MAGYLPYDERRPLIPQDDSPPEGGCFSFICKLLLVLIVGGACVGVFYALRHTFYSGKMAQEPVRGKWSNMFGAVPGAVQSVKEYLKW
jgi:hypothetical protein